MLLINLIILIIFNFNPNNQTELYNIKETNLYFLPPPGFVDKIGVEGKGVINSELNAAFFFQVMSFEIENLDSASSSTKGLIKETKFKSNVKSSKLRLLEINQKLTPDDPPHRQFTCFFNDSINEKSIMIIASKTSNKISWDEYEQLLIKSFETMILKED